MTATGTRPTLLHAARSYYEAGYTAIPLTLDANQLPKRPIDTGWTSVPHDWDRITELSWAGARGLGIVLGQPSSGLCAIDIDDVELALAVYDFLTREQDPPRMVWTPRGRIHVFCQAVAREPSIAFTSLWAGRKAPIELKADGTQVATIPTIRYRIAQKWDPWAKGPTSLWDYIAANLNIETARDLTSYPKPWAETVPAGVRNKSAYVEAHALREGGASLELALECMLRRFQRDYEKGDITWEDIARTVRSAYHRNAGRSIYERGENELSVLRERFGG